MTKDQFRTYWENKYYFNGVIKFFSWIQQLSQANNLNLYCSHVPSHITTLLFRNTNYVMIGKFYFYYTIKIYYTHRGYHTKHEVVLYKYYHPDISLSRKSKSYQGSSDYSH